MLLPSLGEQNSTIIQTHQYEKHSNAPVWNTALTKYLSLLYNRLLWSAVLCDVQQKRLSHRVCVCVLTRVAQITTALHHFRDL